MTRKILYVILLGIAVVVIPSCGGSKNSSSMRQIEKHSRKYPIGEDGLPVPGRSKESKKVKAAKEKQQKDKEAQAKEAEKAYKDAITRHREFQSQETRDRMDQHAKESDKRYSNKKEFFIVRWFRPKDDVEKIEKRRAKEVEKRMAATRKKAEKTNKEFGITDVETPKQQKLGRPNPKDIPQGGGGTYKEGGATRYARPSDMPQGGGGSYSDGKSSGRVRSSDFQQGGGGSYQSGKSGNRQSASDQQQGGGGSYQTGKSVKRQKASDHQQGGGGNMSGKSKKQKKSKTN